LEQSARLNARIGWIRLPIVFAFGGMIVGLTDSTLGLSWLALMLVIERGTTWIRLRLAAGDQQFRRPYFVAIAVISAMWVAASLLLWSADTEVARMAAVVCLLITALAGIVGGQKDPRVSVLLLAPPLSAFFILLTLHLIAHAPPLAAFLGIVATIGACISVVTCAVVLHTSDRNLMRKNEELEQVSRALAESKAFLEETTAVAKVGGWRFDPVTQIVEWSPETRRILELDEAVPPNLQLGLSLYAPEAQPVIIKALRDSLLSDAPWVRELPLALPSGARKWVRVTGKGVSVDGAKVIIGAFQDITERVRLEEELLQAQKLEAIGRLTGGVAHDFNNVLTAILSSAELLENAPEQRTAQLGAAIAKAATRAGDLTTKLLAYSRRQVLNPSALDLNVAVEEAIALLTPMLSDTIAIKRGLHPAPLWAMADPAQLSNAILNLAINAADAMPNGGVLHFATTLDAQGRARLDVTDTGIGMTPELAAKIFDPFFTTKGAGLGTGLGLSMVHGFVNQSGGAIEVDSTPGQGARFTLTFPPSDAAPVARVQAHERAQIETHTRILLVDDDDLVRAALTRMLAEHGFSVAAAATPNAALEQISASEFDLAIVDVALGPNVSGAELARDLIVHAPHMKILLISGYTQEKLDAETRTISFLQKPFTHQALLDSLAALQSPPPARATGA
jgi:signal transduction histidine kinase